MEESSLLINKPLFGIDDEHKGPIASEKANRSLLTLILLIKLKHPFNIYRIINGGIPASVVK